MRKLKQMAILVMTILTFSSCYNRIIPILPPPSIDKEPQHIHSFSNEPMDYEINGTTIVAIYTCECGETKSQVISNDMITADDNNIEINNNINNHYIAECENCGGIFISAVTQSDQQISYITGVCPLCEKETNQYLRWVIKNIDPKNP